MELLPAPRLHEHERQLALGVLGEMLTELPAHAPVVVAGDFNDWRQRAGAVLDRFSIVKGAR